jgi:hypothetical protein
MDSPDIGVGERDGPGKAPVVVIWRVGGEACACQQRGTADGAIEPGGQSGTASPAPDHGRRRLRRSLPAGRYRGFPLAWTTRGAGATRLLMTRPKAVRTIFGQCSLRPCPVEVNAVSSDLHAYSLRGSARVLESARRPVHLLRRRDPIRTITRLAVFILASWRARGIAGTVMVSGRVVDRPVVRSDRRRR